MLVWLHLGEFFARVSMSAILNSLWEGVALAVLAWLTLRAVPRANASMRYGLWCLALIAVLALPIIAIHAATVTASGATGAAAGTPPIAVPQRLAQIMFGLWYAVATILLLRLILSYVHLQRLKASAVPLPPIYQYRVRRWLEASGGRRDCRLCISDKVPMPVAIGLVDPVIVLPERLLEQLSDDELDQIGLHELAHLQRWDDYTNVFQKIVEALLFFNPAVYLIGQQLVLEREIACDDQVILATGKPLTYAICLTRLVEATALTRQALPALGALSSRRQFAIRIERLLDKRRNGFPIASRVAAAAACVVMASALAAAGRVTSVVGVSADTAPAIASAPTPRLIATVFVHSTHAVAHAAVTASAQYANAVRRYSTDVRRAASVARSNAVGARNFTREIALSNVELLKVSHQVDQIRYRLERSKAPHVYRFAFKTIKIVSPPAAPTVIAPPGPESASAAAEAPSPVTVVVVPAGVRIAEIGQVDVHVWDAHGAHVTRVDPRVAPEMQAPEIQATADAANLSDAAPEGAQPTAITSKSLADLAAALRTANRTGLRVAIVGELSKHMDVVEVRTAIIEALLHDGSHLVKLSALRALARRTDLPDARAALLRALRALDSTSVKVQIISVLNDAVRDVEVRRAFVRTLLGDEPVQVQVAAVQALAPVADDPEVHAALEQAGGNGCEIVRLSIKRALSPRPSH